MAEKKTKVEKIRADYDLAVNSEAYKSQRDDYHKSLKNYDGDQWDKDSSLAMTAQKRHPMTVNQLAPAVQQVVNDQRQNRPAVRISPVDGGADRATADVFQGAIRHIEYRSSADAAYDTAFEYAAAGGFGYWGVITEYANPEDAWDLDQELRIRRFPDPDMVVRDPSSVEPDGSDLEFAFVLSRVSKSAFERDWPDAEMASDGFFTAEHPELGIWLNDDGVLIAEYWYVDHKKRRALWIETAEGVIKAFADELTKDELKSARIVRERPYDERTVKMCLTNGHEVLQERDWRGRWIPIIPVYGKEVWIDGERKLRSMIWNAIDSQKLVNASVTSAWETAKLAPKVPWVGYVGQFETDKNNWANIANGLVPYVQVDPVTVDGKPAPLPQRAQWEPAIQALSILTQMAGQFVKTTTGLHGPSLGEEDVNRSGRAILALQEEGDTANFHLVDNLSRSIAHSGRLLLDLIPKTYDTERLIRIIGEDDAEKVIKVARNFELAENGDQLRQEYLSLDDTGRTTYQKQRGYQIDVGRYDVVAAMGPSYQTKRQQSADQLMELSKLFPAQMAPALGVLISTLDLANADELRKVVDPTFEGGEKEIPPQVRQEVQMLENAFTELKGKFDEQQKLIDAKQIESQATERREAMKLQSDQQIAELNNRTKVWITLANNGSEEAIALLQAEMSAQKELLDVAAANASQHSQHAHESQMAIRPA